MSGINSDDKTEIRFDGKVAVVTGAGAGLGRVYAIELAKRGAKVVVNDLGGPRDGSGQGSAGPADSVVEEIRALGGEAVAAYDSVATAEGGEAIVRKAVETFGRLDVLINNAGILRDKSLAKMEPHEWQAVRSVHLDGAYNVSRPAFIQMKENGYGRIIITTSASGLYGNFGQGNYAAAKMGVVGLMNTLKLESAKYDIKVNTIAPMAATRLTEDVMPADLQEKVRPEFVAPLVLYLCSDRCTATGMIFNAVVGRFNRVALKTGPGAVVGDGKTPPSVEQIHLQWAAINNLDGACEHYNATEALRSMVEAFSHEQDVPASSETMTVKDVFDRMGEVFQPEKAAGIDVIFQYHISGPGGGEWYALVKDGRCETASGTHEKPTTTFIMSDDDFLALMCGRLNALKAYSSGKLKIEGDLMKSQLVQKLFKF